MKASVLKLRASAAGMPLKVVTIAGFVLAVIGIRIVIGEIGRWKEEDLAGSAMFIFWGSIIGYFGAKSWRFGPTHLRVDVGRGIATYVEDRRDKTTVPLAELGDLVIQTHTKPPFEWHELGATGLPKATLYRSASLLAVQQHRQRIELIVNEHLLRQLLAHDAPDDGAFRDDPDIAFRARQLIPDRVRMQEALAALDRNGDKALRAKVTELRAALDR